MLIDPRELSQNLDRLEEIEKISLRLVTQAIYDYRIIAQVSFHRLKEKMDWRVQHIPIPPGEFHWDA